MCLLYTKACITHMYTHNIHIHASQTFEQGYLLVTYICIYIYTCVYINMCVCVLPAGIGSSRVAKLLCAHLVCMGTPPDFQSLPLSHLAQGPNHACFDEAPAPCMCRCAYVCVYLCVHVQTQVPTTLVLMRQVDHVCVYVRMYVCIRMCMYKQYTSTGSHACLF
jgi:hypothetical protein